MINAIKEKIFFSLFGALITILIAVFSFFLPRFFPNKKSCMLKIVDVQFDGPGNSKSLSPLNIWTFNEGNTSALLKAIKIEIKNVIHLTQLAAIVYPIVNIS